MTKLYLTTYEVPKNQYRHILIKGVYSYTAFRTDKGLSDFVKRTGADFIKHNEVMTADHGKVQCFVAENIEIQEKSFWKMEDIPENVVKYTDLSNGSLVDCYYTNKNNVYTQYRPNPNAKEVYKPMELKQHIEYVKKYKNRKIVISERSGGEA